MAHSHYYTNYQLRAHRKDDFFQLIKTLLQTPFVMHSRHDAAEQDATALLAKGYEGVLLSIEKLIEEHRENCDSRLKEIVPSVGTFWTPLPLRDAFLRYNQTAHMSGRRFIPPSFNDIRHISNLAQTMALKGHLRLLTMDGDQTLYADGKDFNNPHLAELIIKLLRAGTKVAVVTAAGYQDKPGRYEQRLSGLLRAFKASQLPADVVQGFWVLGGECNFLFQCEAQYTLRALPAEEYMLYETYLGIYMREIHERDKVKAWSPEAIKNLLDVASSSLEAAICRMQLPVKLYRKNMAVGTIRHSPDYELRREQLDELVLSCRYDIRQAGIEIPYCAFNGGNDVWVDVGNKHIGVETLQAYLKVEGPDTIHIGDQFLSTGNDLSARRACTTSWVSSPEETITVLQNLVADLEVQGVE